MSSSIQIGEWNALVWGGFVGSNDPSDDDASALGGLPYASDTTLQVEQFQVTCELPYPLGYLFLSGSNWPDMTAFTAPQAVHPS